MLVSWNWLKDYVALDVEPAELAQRLAMAGLNHESTERRPDDFAIDLEITSNRPDCLGHIGVAREISVLWNRPLRIPSAAGAESATAARNLTSVAVECPELCPRYIARVIRGVKVGPSPKWLVERLATINVAAINNVVDISNHVLMECGQPLHAFDFAKLNERRIVVRRAADGERLEAIDHRTYQLDRTMCVIADATTPVAIGGVMGGAKTEVTATTTDLLIEAADFTPMSIRATARKLGLHSPSSYRFERGVDPAGVDWASRRCCQMILELAGGELAAGSVDIGPPYTPLDPVVLRLSQLKRILGIEIAIQEVQRILTALGGQLRAADDRHVEIVPPSWRRDLTREIDLVEEVARIHGYDQIPEDVGVPMAPSHRSDHDRVLAKVRGVLTAAGFDEAMTASVVPAEWSAAFSPWTDAEPLVSSAPMLRGADRLRRSIVPSLLEARRVNESLANPAIELFETARIYLPTGDGLPREPWTLAMTSGGDFYFVKGVVEGLLAALNPAARLEAVDTSQPLLAPERSCELQLNGRRFGFLGELLPVGLQQFGLRGATTVAEVDLSVLMAAADLIRQYSPQSPFPAISRDLNFVVDEPLRWSELATTVREIVGQSLEQLEYRETFRDTAKDGAGKKRLLLTITLRRADRTLTGDEADAIRDQVVTACNSRHGAALLA